MRYKHIYISVCVVCNLLFWASTYGVDINPNTLIDVKSVDLSKVKTFKYATFIENGFWPSEALIQSKKISLEDIPQEVNEFRSMVFKVFKSTYRPTGGIVDANLTAVEDLRNEGDYLLLSYRKERCDIQIQDGKAFYVLFRPDNIDANDVNLPEYVKSVFLLATNAPKVDANDKEPRLFVSELDIGKSSCGSITYEGSFPPPRFWYSHVRWWSDGRSVLFAIGKKEFREGYRRSGPPKDIDKPRKFKKSE